MCWRWTRSQARSPSRQASSGPASRRSSAGTFLLRAEDDVAAEPLYEAAWDEAAAACHAAGGTIAHHHGIGRLKARFPEAELGTNGLQLLRRLRRAADPAGILNPPE
ncbi:MAG TPA: FAD-linked oxidase C-terminal domain-containing protein [Gaiellaceae bacterium]|nr:FAD-linked oxidase C-terminal domain-containing protein [Gaiellaceae bacterium]